MKMTDLEKRFVNRKKQAEGNIKIVESDLQRIDSAHIKTVLELGSGIGFVSSYLAETFDYIVYGTDYDPEQVQQARDLQTQNEHLHFQVEDATDLSFEDAAFDLVISQNVFHHIPDWERAIAEIARVLKPGGVFIWADLAFARMVRDLFKPFVKNYGLYTIDDLKTAFTLHGLNTLFVEHLSGGLMSQHHFVLDKTGETNDSEQMG